MNNIIFIFCITLLYVTMFLLSCQPTYKNNVSDCIPEFFQVDSSDFSDNLYNIKPYKLVINNNALCGYRLIINDVCKGRIDPIYSTGHIFDCFVFFDSKKKIVYQVPIGYSSKPYPLFDFKIKNHDTFTTKFIRKYVNELEKTYSIDSILCKVSLVNHFVDATTNEKDSIFQYKFTKFNYLKFYNTDDLVIFVSLRRGIQGIYHTFTHKNEFEEIFCWKGKVYKESMAPGKSAFVKNFSFE